MRKLLIISLFILMSMACTWENEEDLFGIDLCDTLDVSYSRDVVPILAGSCYECHSNSNAPDFAQGIAFEDYKDAFSYSTSIVGAINHEDGFPAMPKGAGKLDSCSISVIEAWVNQGAPDN